MKDFSNLDIVLKLPLGDKSKTPAPFFGKVPTRIFWSIAWQRPTHIVEGQVVPREKKIHHVEYVGKPNPEQARRFDKLLQSHPNHLYELEVRCGEFDRKHILLQQTYFYKPGRGEAGPRTLRTVLWDAYHPWQPLGYYLDYMRQKNWVKNIGGFRVYSTVKVLKQEYIAKYKLWMLDNCGKQLKSTAERKAEREEAKKARRMKVAVPGEYPNGRAGAF